MPCISSHTITSVTILRFWLTYMIFNHHLSVIVSIQVYDDAVEHVIPHSDQEDPRRPATRLEHVVPGHWVKLPPGRDVRLGFIPTRTYAQVRHRDTVKKVPREEAFRDAKIDEERENAARLKEAVSKWKSNTYYKEEGYEDAAYDHGGHERNANFDEGYKSHAATPKTHENDEIQVSYSENDRNFDPKSFVRSEIAKLNENLEIEYGEAAKRTQIEVPENLRDFGDEESSEQEVDVYEDRSSESPAIAEATTIASDYIATPSRTQMGPPALPGREKMTDSYNSISGADFNPRIRALSSAEDSSSSADYEKLSVLSHYKSEKIATTSPATKDSPKSETTFQDATKSLENPEDYYPSLTKIYDAWKKEGIEHIYLKPSSEQEVSANSQKSNSSGEEATSEEKRLKKNWNKPHTLIIRAPTTPCNSSQAPELYLLDSTPNRTGNSVAEVIKTADGQNLVVMQPPSLQPLGQVTYADFLSGNGPGRPSMTQESGSIQETNPGVSMGPSSPSLYRYYRHQQRHRPPRMTDQDFRRRLVRLIMMLPPSPVKSSQYAQYRRRNGDARPQRDLWPKIFRNYKPVYRLHEKIVDNNAGTTVPLTKRRKRNLELLDKAPEIVDDIISKELRTRFPEEKNRIEIKMPEYNFSAISEDREEEKSKFQEALDTEKFPFYKDEKISDLSALKYAMAPHQVPKKTLGGTEFYDSRDRYMECDEINPDLSDVAVEKRDSTEDQDPPIRLEGLGDKLSCYQAKYFDRNPLDNPLFTEKQISPFAQPPELDIASLRARLSTLSGESEPSITRRMSRKPEILNSNPASWKNEIIRDKKRNNWSNHARRDRKRHPVTTSAPSVKLYEKQVYEDVMGTIKNQANMHQARPRLRAISIHGRPQNQTNQLTFKPTGAALPGPLSPSGRYKTMSHSVNRYRGSRPRGETANHIIGYIRRVRVHKRSIDTSWAPAKSSIFPSSFARQTKQPMGTSVPETSSRPSEKVVYTIRDLIRHSKPRGSTRFADFPASSTPDSRRNEPRYTPIRKLDDDIYKVEYREKKRRAKEAIGVEDQGEIDGRARKKGKKRYDVHENVEEEQPGGIEISNKMEEPFAADDTPANESEEIEKPAAYGNKLRKDAENSGKNEKDEEDEEEQLEKPSNYYSEDSCDGSGDDNEESSDHQEEDTDVTEEPDGEKEFDAFVGQQPFSRFGSFEHDTFSSMGEGVDKPPFYKPSFMSFTSHKPWKYRGPTGDDHSDDSSEQTSSKYVFPWHADDNDASEESRRHEKIIGRHEFPWERRQRLTKEREKFQTTNPSDDDVDNSETMIDLKRIQPWSDDWFSDSFDSFNSGFRPMMIHREFPEHVEKFHGEEMAEKTTPFVRQIPPTTSAPASTSPRQSTTPTTKTFSGPIYRVRSRAKARKTTSKRLQPSIAPVTTNPSAPRLPRRSGQSARRLKQYNNPQRPEFITNNRRSSRITSAMSSTTPSSSRRISINNSRDKSVIPTSKNVERRSKMSKEEIFTETSYPELDKNHPKMGVVKKISIITKHTPKHIFRTEEIDKNGVKDIFMSIIPNNSTENSPEIDINNIKSFSNIENIPSRYQEINLPIADDLVKLSDYDAETILSQMSAV